MESTQKDCLRDAAPSPKPIFYTTSIVLTVIILLCQEKNAQIVRRISANPATKLGKIVLHPNSSTPHASVIAFKPLKD